MFFINEDPLQRRSEWKCSANHVLLFQGGVKPVHRGHPRGLTIGVSVDRWSLNRGVLVSLRWSTEQTTVASVDRWSLNRGVLVSLRWSMDQPTVVSVDRWSLNRGGP